MTINKFQGKTEEEAIEKAKAEFGPNVVIMNVKEIKPKGFFSIFKSSTYEVTAAIEENSNSVNASNTSGLFSNQKFNLGAINVAADEAIEIPKPTRETYTNTIISKDGFLGGGYNNPTLSNTGASNEASSKGWFQKELEQNQNVFHQPNQFSSLSSSAEEQQFKERLNNLSDMLEQRLAAVNPESVMTDPFMEKPQVSEEMNFVRILYKTLIDNEVSEKYVNQVMEEMERLIRPGNTVDSILANVYQKLVLKFGQPKTIDVSGTEPNVIFFIGPTGVGKTTTIAKIASKYRVELNKKVAFITADTYRIAATEQLRIYANILDAPMSIVYSVDEINEAIAKYMDYDLIFVDTAGFSHKNNAQKEEMQNLINGVNTEYKKEVYLVVSATTKYKDLLDIIDIHQDIYEYKLIFTKLDETSCYGNILNIKLYSGADLSYVTYGQNVPDDIEVFDTQKIVKQLLGGR